MYPRVIINEFLAAKDRGESVTSPRLKLTQALCLQLPARPYNYEVRDTEQRSLRVRVRPTGHRSLEVAKKIHGANCRSKVCTVGDLAFKDVRALAQQLLLDMMQGRTATAKRQEQADHAVQTHRLALTVHYADTVGNQ